MIDTDSLSGDSLPHIREYVRDAVDGETSVSDTIDALHLLLVLSEEKRGTTIAIPTRRDDEMIDVTRKYTTSPLADLLKRCEIPHLTRIEDRPLFTESIPEPHNVCPSRGIVFVTLDVDALDTIEINPDDYHTSLGRFHGYPREDIEAFPEETPTGKSVETLNVTPRTVGRVFALMTSIKVTEGVESLLRDVLPVREPITARL